MAFEHATQAADAALRTGAIPMAVVGVAVGGSIMVVEAIDADPVDLLYVATITEPIVATAAMRLVSRTELDLLAPLSSRRDLTPANARPLRSTASRRMSPCRRRMPPPT